MTEPAVDFTNQTVGQLFDSLADSGDSMRTLLLQDEKGELLGAFVALQGPHTQRYLEAIEGAIPSGSELSEG